ncbi:hypothetical protein [Streptomyces minutiscleroticus]|uniref:Secreted protein n=1 Tax=Streptomyces minutiscleroticus TaxID=68238 RepID=A0A918NBT0_9ACTN|nr:hypothetical protein [Streptomyces minutiscleroticus]GGX58866.1 hypothetical protein GCM10010358_11260 [Streptomyces minutiscleroticus]
MNRNRRLVRRGTVAAFTTVAVAGLGPAGLTASGASAAAAPQTKEIASSVLGEDYRFTLTAVRSADDAYAATVRLQVYTYDGGVWTESDRATVGEADGWFWYPLTGKGGVCRFSTSAADPAPVDVSLLITPSIGCSGPEHFVVENGTIRA